MIDKGFEVTVPWQGGGGGIANGGGYFTFHMYINPPMHAQQRGRCKGGGGGGTSHVKKSTHVRT